MTCPLAFRKDTRGCRQGYMGHLIRLTNQIAGNARALSLDMAGTLSLNRSLEETRLQEELDEETYRLWSEFITGPVTDMNKKNNTNLVGYYYSIHYCRHAPVSLLIHTMYM